MATEFSVVSFYSKVHTNPWGFHFTQTNYNHIFPSNNFFSQNSIMIIIITMMMMMILIIIILISSWDNMKDICLSDKFMIDNKKNTHFVKILIKLWILTSPLTRVNKLKHLKCLCFDWLRPGVLSRCDRTTTGAQTSLSRVQGLVVQSWVKITQGYCEIWFQIWKL